MNTLSDKELKQLFKNKQIEIEDNGFTKNVMKHIPHRKDYNNWIIGISASIGILIVIFSGAFKVLMEQIFSFVTFIAKVQLPTLESTFVYLLALSALGGIFYFSRSLNN